MKQRLLFVFGTRPEAIKMLPIIYYAKKHYSSELAVKACITGQHRGMLDQVLDLFDIRPDYDLDIMKPNQDLYDITSKVLLGLRPVLDDCQPSCVLVHGDTTTTLAASLAAYYKKIPVAHVEAGLRTHDIYSPWPEEINRRVTGCVASYHFAPTEVSKNNLSQENVTNHVVVVGNSVIDSLLYAVRKIDEDISLKIKIDKFFAEQSIIFDKKIILVTGHRRENFGQGFINICAALKEIAEKNPNIQIVYPVHLNPNVQGVVYEILSDIENIKLIDPLDYVQFVYLMKQSYLILTDSGGVQEEAPSLNKPVLVLRDTSERPEAVQLGGVKLVGTNKENIVNAVMDLLNNVKIYNEMSAIRNPYGDGNAAKLILEYLINNMSGVIYND